MDGPVFLASAMQLKMMVSPQLVFLPLIIGVEPYAGYNVATMKDSVYFGAMAGVLVAIVGYLHVLFDPLQRYSRTKETSGFVKQLHSTLREAAVLMYLCNDQKARENIERNLPDETHRIAAYAKEFDYADGQVTQLRSVAVDRFAVLAQGLCGTYEK
ncbi:hypothetical protein SARC_02162 [Sphaeroforma arctica JP610]|uniref:Uncharacterized protein n=1 Tax=Sphaeroforma arctica JP610 TaxID=667725 RepID=A0A0L0GBQ7_9EUKA|nr:hypothetical protein SARC_02162 [Sphaeroforma arctica JP610]KNC85678.1 hypothetical protein SARC_02162 [Sphaeroforma arctica JP610]|eukprot:XP_014159580.1 hypothetical protein SARC_02162 [Sphaeroforma arctica JP610]